MMKMVQMILLLLLFYNVVLFWIENTQQVLAVLPTGAEGGQDEQDGNVRLGGVEEIGGVVERGGGSRTATRARPRVTQRGGRGRRGNNQILGRGFVDEAPEIEEENGRRVRGRGFVNERSESLGAIVRRGRGRANQRVSFTTPTLGIIRTIWNFKALIDFRKCR